MKFTRVYTEIDIDQSLVINGSLSDHFAAQARNDYPEYRIVSVEVNEDPANVKIEMEFRGSLN